MGLLTFEVHLRSHMTFYQEGHSLTAPFPGCRFNGEEKRWEWSCQYMISLVELTRALGHPVLLRPLGTRDGDLDVLEVLDNEEEDDQ